MNQQDLKRKVREVAGTLLYENGYISPVDLLVRLGRLSKEDYENWRFGRIQYLERVCVGNLSKLTVIMKELKKYADEKKLHQSSTVYKKWGKGKKVELRFSKTGNSQIEEAYATHYLAFKGDK